MLKVLIKSGADLETVNDLDQSALHVAVDSGKVKAAEILLNNGANPNQYSSKFHRSILGTAFSESTFHTSFK